MVRAQLPLLLLIVVSCASQTATQKTAPALAIETAVWEFGTIERGQTVTKTVPVANTGSDTLELELFSTCECLSASPQRLALSAGGKAVIELAYMGDEIKAPITKTVFIDSNDPDRPRLDFKVTGTITPGKAPHLAALPDPLPVDPSSPGYPQAELKITNLGKEVLKIGDITCFGCVNSWSERAVASGEAVLLSVTPLPDWVGKRWLEIESNDPIHPLKKIAIVEFD
jgi:hypothetical protein